MSTEATTRPRVVRPAEPSKIRATVGAIVLVLVVNAAGRFSNAAWGNLSDLLTDGWKYFYLMVKGVVQNPFSDPYSGYWTEAVKGMLESISMAWIGTMIGAVLSVPLGFLAARNVAHPVVVQVTRVFLNIVRTIPELIFAIILLLPIFGFGPNAGALALGVGAIGTLGKLTAEALEGIDPGPVEAARAAGASHGAILRWTYWSQVLPEVLAFWLYRFEINIRASAILGVIGAGGIGAVLNQAFRYREWDYIGILLFVIIVVTVLVDTISGAVRHRIIAGTGVTDRDIVTEPVGL
ncbi:phosphonate ABC transporter, permease protein PhnE [Demequina capsici]|uniref:Phosphonate ABC transporter, permease protein PhnE n=1 Tax=Demequina capsici TaxID=3075620 RepID=A0AA96FBG3_9MICO|nr:phosphonate ABC transporter, permease protein PhnE [Demequina sp. OYTSA14]WNM25526.1 phosphonate ABC transporter, permease protein PhnE [Demequina sp. OYTSA14]